MHTLLKPLNNSMNTLINEFENHVRKQGMDLLTASGAEPSQFVSNIQALHEKYSKMVLEIFREDGEFTAALDRVSFLIPTFFEKIEFLLQSVYIKNFFTNNSHAEF